MKSTTNPLWAHGIRRKRKGTIDPDVMKYGKGVNPLWKHHNLEELHRARESRLKYTHIGEYYSDGVHVPINRHKALTAFETAATLGDKDAYNRVGLMYLNTNSKKAHMWFKKGHDVGSKSATVSLGMSYLFGFGVKRDYKKAFDCFQSTTSFADSNYYLGYMYYNGKHVDRDSTKALVYFKKGARENEVAAYYAGMIYMKGVGVPVNVNKAVHYLQMGADKGSYGAAQRLRRLLNKKCVSSRIPPCKTNFTEHKGCCHKQSKTFLETCGLLV